MPAKGQKKVYRVIVTTGFGGTSIFTFKTYDEAQKLYEQKKALASPSNSKIIDGICYVELKESFE